jgi:hypothetical protein
MFLPNTQVPPNEPPLPVTLAKSENIDRAPALSGLRLSLTLNLEMSADDAEMLCGLADLTNMDALPSLRSRLRLSNRKPALTRPPLHDYQTKKIAYQ